MTKNATIIAVIAIVTAIGAIVGIYNLRAKKTPPLGNSGTQEQRQKQQPSQEDLKQDQATIANFMGDKNYQVVFTDSHAPTNFTVGIAEPFPNGGGSHITVPQEWQRSVNIYESKDYIADSCEVYRFEVYPKTHEVVNVGLVEPKEKIACDDSRSILFASTINAEQIQTIGEKYLERAMPEKYATLKNKFIARPVSKDGENDRREWVYEDKDYQTPPALEAEPKYPTIRLYISNSGNLLQYENSLPLFEK